MKIKKEKLEKIIREELIREVTPFDMQMDDRVVSAAAGFDTSHIRNPSYSDFLGVLNIIRNINPIEFLPIIGDAIDLRQFFDAMGDGNYGAAALASVGFIPFGDIAQLIGKNKKQIRQIEDTLSRMDPDELAELAEDAVKANLKVSTSGLRQINEGLYF